MIETKTTHKIIIEEIGETINALEFTKCVDEAPSLQKVWVGLESLKKETAEMILKARRPYLPDDYVNGYIQALLNIQYLCNLQEQKGMFDKDILREVNKTIKVCDAIPKKCTCKNATAGGVRKNPCGRCGGEL